MAFSVPPGPVARRSRWPVAILAGLACLIVGAAILGRSGPVAGPAHGASSAPRAALVATAVPSTDGGHAAAGLPAPLVSALGGPAGIAGPGAALPIALPPVRSCQGGDARWCHQVLRAAMLAFVRDGASSAAGSSILSATVWRSMACGDALDCPPYRLAGTTPVGSVVLEFADGGPRAWINVVGPPATRELDGGPGGGLQAWVARWG